MIKKIIITLALLIGFGVCDARTIDISYFSGAETLIDFNDIQPTEKLDTQYQSLGVTFGGGGHGDPFERSTINGSMGITNYSIAPNLSFSAPIEALFDQPQSAIGFYLGGTDQVIRDYHVGVYGENGLIEEGVFLADTLFPGGTLLSVFIGFESSFGINKVVMRGDSANWVFQIDDFRFQSTLTEPDGFWFFLIGVIGVAVRLGIVKAQNSA